MSWSQETNLIAFVSNKNTYFWNPFKNLKVATIRLATDSISLSFAPNGRMLAICDGNLIKFFDVAR